jgi:hypothetical protein
MPKITTHLVSAKPKAFVTTKVRRKHRDPSDTERTYTTHCGGVTRCSRCPPKRCCDDCARINNARQMAGLIRPSGDPRPSPDNIIHPTVVGKYRGPSIQRRYKDLPQPVVTAFVEPLGKGWRRGVATLNGRRIYVGKPMRTIEQAFAYATQCQRLIKMGLEFESELAEQGLL